MKVTDVRLRKIQTDGRMKALVSITLDESFVVHDLRVIEGNSGLFVAMPSKRTPDGEFRDIAHPINSEMRQEIQDAVMRFMTKLMKLSLIKMLNHLKNQMMKLNTKRK